MTKKYYNLKQITELLSTGCLKVVKLSSAEFTFFGHIEQTVEKLIYLTESDFTTLLAQIPTGTDITPICLKIFRGHMSASRKIAIFKLVQQYLDNNTNVSFNSSKFLNVVEKTRPEFLSTLLQDDKLFHDYFNNIVIELNKPNADYSLIYLKIFNSSLIAEQKTILFNTVAQYVNNANLTITNNAAQFFVSLLDKAPQFLLSVLENENYMHLYDIHRNIIDNLKQLPYKTCFLAQEQHNRQHYSMPHEEASTAIRTQKLITRYTTILANCGQIISSILKNQDLACNSLQKQIATTIAIYLLGKNFSPQNIMLSNAIRMLDVIYKILIKLEEEPNAFTLKYINLICQNQAQNQVNTILDPLGQDIDIYIATLDYSPLRNMLIQQVEARANHIPNNAQLSPAPLEVHQAGNIQEKPAQIKSRNGCFSNCFALFFNRVRNFFSSSQNAEPASVKSRV